MGKATNLVQQFKRTQRTLQWKAFLLVLPLLAFITIVFIIPIATILFNSTHNDVIHSFLPKTVAKLAAWEDSQQIPSEATFQALVEDLTHAKSIRRDGKIATRLNYEKSGLLSLVKETSRQAKKLKPPFQQSLIKLDKRWGEVETWQIIKRESGRFTASFYVAAVDKEYNKKGEIVDKASQESIYLSLFARTLIISAFITLICIVLGFPIAYLLSNSPVRVSNLLMIFVLLPFWTSLLVRTTSWIVLLQTHGTLNDLLVFFGLIDDRERVQMVYNMTGTIIAMTHILLPFMILPIYSVMKNIPPTYMRAAISLGASWSYAFRKIYLPLAIPGVGAGGLLVFILAVGYYVTPALVGGSSGQFISNLIAYHLQNSLNWGLASALSAFLLLIVLLFYWIYNKFFGIDRLRF